MSKYIDSEKLIAEIERYKNKADERLKIKGRTFSEEQKDLALQNLCGNLLHFITSLQQEQGIKDVCACIEEYYGEALQFEDERTKAAYHFFSAGCSFELRKIEEESKQHIVDLLENYRKGKRAGYQKAVTALKDGKIEGNPVMMELLSKILGSGFGFSSSLPACHEQPDKYETALKKAREWMPNVNHGGHAILISIFPELGEGLDPRYGGRKQAQPEVDLEKEIQEYIKECLDVKFPTTDIEIIKKDVAYTARYFYELGLKARKEE